MEIPRNNVSHMIIIPAPARTRRIVRELSNITYKSLVRLTNGSSLVNSNDRTNITVLLKLRFTAWWYQLRNTEFQLHYKRELDSNKTHFLQFGRGHIFSWQHFRRDPRQHNLKKIWLRNTTRTICLSRQQNDIMTTFISCTIVLKIKVKKIKLCLRSKN
jgi:hypothetical protein